MDGEYHNTIEAYYSYSFKVTGNVELEYAEEEVEGYTVTMDSGINSSFHVSEGEDFEAGNTYTVTTEDFYVYIIAMSQTIYVYKDGVYYATIHSTNDEVHLAVTGNIELLTSKKKPSDGNETYYTLTIESDSMMSSHCYYYTYGDLKYYVNYLSEPIRSGSVLYNTSGSTVYAYNGNTLLATLLSDDPSSYLTVTSDVRITTEKEEPINYCSYTNNLSTYDYINCYYNGEYVDLSTGLIPEYSILYVRASDSAISVYIGGSFDRTIPPWTMQEIEVTDYVVLSHGGDDEDYEYDTSTVTISSSAIYDDIFFTQNGETIYAYNGTTYSINEGTTLNIWTSTQSVSVYVNNVLYKTIAENTQDTYIVGSEIVSIEIR